jgi:pyrimidine operon attenuation protein / uracil phosphoribosyltransferase
LGGHAVVIVDDVLYQGYSMLRALQYLVQKQPAVIRTVVLVDRGTTKVPMHADVIGARLDIAEGDIIECNVPPYEDELKIELLQK